MGLSGLSGGQSALPHIPPLGLRLEGHGFLKHVLSVVTWFRSTRGKVQIVRHILNLDHVMFAKIPLSKTESQRRAAPSIHLSVVARMWAHDTTAGTWSVWAHDCICHSQPSWSYMQNTFISPQDPQSCIPSNIGLKVQKIVFFITGTRRVPMDDTSVFRF